METQFLKTEYPLLWKNFKSTYFGERTTSDNYMGEDFRGISFFSKNPASDTLEIANFIAATKILKENNIDFDVINVGHWGVGSIEFNLINIDTLSEAQADILTEVLYKYNRYPIIDEKIYDELESEFEEENS